MIDKDSLEAAAQLANLVEEKEPDVWMLEEGMDYRETMEFSAKEAFSIVEQIARNGYPINSAVEAVCMGILVGLRYANLIHKNQVPDTLPS